LWSSILSDRFYLKRVKNVWTIPFTTLMIAGDNREPQGVLKWGVDVLFGQVPFEA
jgi:hypothetical protein